MRRNIVPTCRSVGAFCLAVVLTAATSGADGISPAADRQAREILEAAGVAGGVVVHVGCGDGTLTAALHAGDGFLVQGLAQDAEEVEAARRTIQSLGLYGKVTVLPWSGGHRGDGRGRLPYIDNMVNLVVCEEPETAATEEVMRVLAPGGVACIKEGGRWTTTIKPRPGEIDEWTHYLHDPSGNAVAHDEVIAPPSRLQWIGGPRYSRHHDHMSATSAMVSAAGRNFYILDEAPRQSILTPPEWNLVARDAFNGTVLWKRPMGPWHTHLWPLKSGPQMLPRRLVARGDRVYATLAIDGPVTAIDAAAGRTVRTYENTRATEEILLDDGVLYLVVADPSRLRSDPNHSFTSVQEVIQLHQDQSWGPEPRAVMAVDAETGAVRWRVSTGVTPMTLAADGERVYFHDGEKIVCLDQQDGARRWASPPVPLPEFMSSQGAAVLVVSDGVVLFAGGMAGERDRRGTGLCALSAADGSLLWNATQPFVWQTLRDVLVTDGAVWGGEVHSGAGEGLITGRDLRTGEVVRQFPCDVDLFWFHHRCYRAKATDNYLLYSRNGIEFVDYRNSHWIPHHWVRGGCMYGIMPCNGLIYSPPHPCACYSEAKLYGFNAIAPASKHLEPRREVPDEERLERGPAYTLLPSAAGGREDDWPTYRHDTARSGATRSAVLATDLKSAWETELGGRLSSLTVAEGKVFVSAIDAHTVHALDEESGEPAWSFTAGGRVDSPPTIWQGRVLFGSADGHVYCLRVADGRLAWRFRAAPEDRQLGAMEQLESVWPVHGSVLVENGTLYCVAGRSMFLDGGLRMLRLDPASGRKISETILDDRDPATGDSLLSHVSGLNMPVALPDVLSSDGRYVYMRSLPFDMEGKRKFVAYVDVNQQQGDDVHLFSPTGFLDDTMWHRTYFVYGRAWASGAGGYYQAGQVAPAGRLLVFDDSRAYGFGRLWQYYRWTTPMEFHLFAMDKQPEIVNTRREGPRPDAESGKTRKEAKKEGNPPLPRSRVESIWSGVVAVQVSAMLLADRTLFVAGPPDVVDEERAARVLDDAEIQTRLAEQGAAFEGRRGGILLAVSADDAKKLAAYRIGSMPVFDGMVTAGGRLYLATSEGKVLCIGPGDGEPLSPADDVDVTARSLEDD